MIITSLFKYKLHFMQKMIKFILAVKRFVQLLLSKLYCVDYLTIIIKTKIMKTRKTNSYYYFKSITCLDEN